MLGESLDKYFLFYYNPLLNVVMMCFFFVSNEYFLEQVNLILFNVNVLDLMLDKLRVTYYGFFDVYWENCWVSISDLPYKFTSASYMYDVYSILRSVIVIKKSIRFGKTKLRGHIS